MAEEKDEVMVRGNLLPTQEFNRVKNSVCLLIPGQTGDKIDGQYINPGWRASGFYVQLMLAGNKQKSCIITNHHVFEVANESNDAKMLAVFNHDNKEELANNIELPLVPFKIIAANKELDYVLISVDSGKMEKLGIEPIIADGTYIPRIDENVHIIQHPQGKTKHFSVDRVRRIVTPFIEYFADTEGGSSGSPVFIIRGVKFHLVALHCKGIVWSSEKWNKGVLIKCILDHLTTGKYTLSLPEIPAIVESGHASFADSEKHKKVVSDKDILIIHIELLRVWEPLSRLLKVPQHVLDAIDLDNRTVAEKSFQMLTKWKHIMVDQATYGALADALNHPTINRNDLSLEILKKGTETT